MKANTNKSGHVLTEDQKNDIKDKVQEIFEEETGNIIQMDLSKFAKEIASMTKQFEIQQKSNKYRGDFNTYNFKENLRKDIAKRSALAARGYILIFKFREYITGQTINYRYYFQDHDGQVYVCDFDEYRLLDFIEFFNSVDGIKIWSTEIQKQSKKATEDLNERFNAYTGNIPNRYFEYAFSGEKSKSKKVTYEIIRKYHGNLGLFQNPYTELNKRRRQIFNEGHIFESLDTTISYLIIRQNSSEKLELTSKLIDDYMFGKFLSLDTVNAAKGPDNPFSGVSVKSNKANLYSFNAIGEKLYEINELLKINNKEQIKQKINAMFLDSSNKNQIKGITDAMEEDIDKHIDSFIGELLKWKNKT